VETHVAKKRKQKFERDLLCVAVATERLKKDRPSLAARIIRIMADLAAGQRPPRDRGTSDS
jgi:hypothetical protein